MKSVAYPERVLLILFFNRRKRKTYATDRYRKCLDIFIDPTILKPDNPCHSSDYITEINNCLHSSSSLFHHYYLFFFYWVDGQTSKQITWSKRPLPYRSSVLYFSKLPLPYLLVFSVTPFKIDQNKKIKTVQ